MIAYITDLSFKVEKLKVASLKVEGAGNANQLRIAVDESCIDKSRYIHQQGAVIKFMTGEESGACRHARAASGGDGDTRYFLDVHVDIFNKVRRVNRHADGQPVPGR